MKSKTLKKIGFLALAAGVFYLISRDGESKKDLEIKFKKALDDEDYELANEIRKKLKNM